MLATRVPSQRTPIALLSALLLALSASPLMAQDMGKAYEGKAVRIGKGQARTVVRTNAAGQLQSIGVVFTESMLDGLPMPDMAPKNAMGDFPYPLPMPSKGPKTVFDHVVINWESMGHPPPKVYDVPHFDFHFYMVSSKEQMHTMFKSEAESGDPAQQPAAELMPAGYILPPGTAVPQMGVHAVNPASPEFKGQPFTATFIYGYHNKHQAFLEPMVSLAFLQSKAPFSATVTRPASYSKAGKYPSTYSVKYDEASKSYAVTLEDLQ